MKPKIAVELIAALLGDTWGLIARFLCHHIQRPEKIGVISRINHWQ
jgi:hypothetical protein